MFSGDEIQINNNIYNLPLVPLRDIVIFPHMIVPLFIGRGKSIKALEESMMNDRRIVLTAQKQPNIDDPAPDDLYSTGTLCDVLNLVKLPDGTIKVLIEGTSRVTILEYLVEDDYFVVRVEDVQEQEEKDIHTEALMREVLSKFDKYVRMTRTLPPEAYTSASSVEEPGRLADLITSQLVLKVEEKQSILDRLDPRERLSVLSELLDHELEIIDVQKRIQVQVKKQIEQSQKEYYLKEQLKAIHRELGEEDEYTDEIELIRKKMKKAKLPKPAREKVEAEIKRLSKMPMGSAEAVVVRNYIDWILDLPWAKTTRDNLDIDRVRKVLDEDHYGLDKIKERIVEYLAVRKLSRKAKGAILCFVGPPGVGKTSLGRSIARALDRKYVRASLGGVRDEAEIRGHRRTYIGSMPGRILQQMKKAGTTNPVFLLDEIDKMSTDFRGDPAAALLEVLDPEMNHEFSDHYLEISYDISDVLFITTANLVQPIPSPLLDRMEIIQLPGYTEDEKLHIAKLFLIPKQMERNGLDPSWIKLPDSVILEVIRRYTREAGVRNLEREIEQICRKFATKVVEKISRSERDKQKKYAQPASDKKSDESDDDIDTSIIEIEEDEKPSKNNEVSLKKLKIPTETITLKTLHKYLGQPKYRYGLIGDLDEVGVSTGMAWTQAGGEILNIEVTLMKGKGSLILTGQLGDVMKESATAALSYARSHAELFDLADDYFLKTDVHMHVPEGAIPKDGPSAGVALTTALFSALSGIPVNRNVAITGEITLRGKVLPVGGIKEKVLAAHRAGIRTVALPEENEKDYNEIPENVRKDLKVVFCTEIPQAIETALVKKLTPKSGGSRKRVKKS